MLRDGNLFYVLTVVPENEQGTYGAAFNYRPTTKLTTSFSFDRDTKPSNRLDSTYALTDALSLQATYALGYRVSVSLGGSQTTSEFEGPLLRPGLDVQDDEMRAIFGAVNFKLNERLSVSVDGRHEERETDVPGFNYEGERVAVSALAAF